MIQKSVVFLFLLLCFACSSIKQNTPTVEEGACSTLVSVKNFTGLDGCTLLLVTANGQKLLPMEAPSEISWKPGEQYMIDYSPIEDALSICMAENEIVKVSCAKLIAEMCTPSQTGIDNDLLKTKIVQGGVQRIIRYEYQGSWVYRINSSRAPEFINCQGVSLCPNEGEKFSDCFKRYRPELASQKIIYQGEGPQE